LALTVQLPTDSSVSVVPLTEQVLDGVEKVTASPDVAVAVSAPGAVPSVWLVAGPVKLMLCAAPSTPNEAVTVGAEL
jgi:hypothetical protein